MRPRRIRRGRGNENLALVLEGAVCAGGGAMKDDVVKMVPIDWAADLPGPRQGRKRVAVMSQSITSPRTV